MPGGRTNSPRKKEEEKSLKERENECSLVGEYRDLSRQQQRIEKKKKELKIDGGPIERGCRRSFGTEVAATIIERL